MGDLNKAESRGASTVSKGTRSQMLDVRGEETRFEERVIEHKRETYDIITINMNGNSGDGTTDRRRNLIVSFLKDSSASVIFCQEVQSERKLNQKVAEKFGPGVYEFAFTGKESAVMWRTSDFHGDRRSVKGTDSSIKKIVERLQRTRPDVDVSEVCTRSAMVKLTSRKTGASFLAVSWHGPSTVSDESKPKALDGLICFLCEVCKIEKLSSFIIGGDFNLDTSRVDLTKHKGVTICRYELCARDKNKVAPPRKPGHPFIPYKDTFIVSVTVPSDERFMTGDITVSSVRPLDLEPKNESSGNKLMDHVPVVGDLKLQVVRSYKKPYIEEDRGKLDSIFRLTLSDRFLLI